jgi:hypothetical protein
MFGIGCIWWWNDFLQPGWHADGSNYQAAIDLVLSGRSPYEHRLYPYPPTLAVLGAWVSRLWGEETFRTVFRLFNILGGCAAIWGSLLITNWSLRLRLCLGAFGVLTVPTFLEGLNFDNVSTLVSGAAISGLVLWHRLPVAAGIFLGLSLALKPIALLAFFLLLFHRPLYPQKRHILAVGIAAVTTGLFLAIRPLLFLSAFRHPNVIKTMQDWSLSQINISLYRLLVDFGLNLSPFLVLMIILMIGIVLIRIRPLDPDRLACLACAASLLSIPVVWEHTLLLALPIQTFSFAVAVRRALAFRKSYPPPVRDPKLQRPLVHLLLVSAGIITVFEGGRYGVLGKGVPWLHGVMLLIPTSAIVLLTGYVLRFNWELQKSSAAA